MRYFFRPSIPDKSVEINPDLPNLSRLSWSLKIDKYPSKWDE